MQHIITINTKPKHKGVKSKMSDKKIDIKICPFQTQLGISIPPAGHKPLFGSGPNAQIIKVACDQEKCQLWNADYGVCAVSLFSAQVDTIGRQLECIESAIRDNINPTHPD
jgi:hypothetical protein